MLFFDILGWCLWVFSLGWPPWFWVYVFVSIASTFVLCVITWCLISAYLFFVFLISDRLFLFVFCSIACPQKQKECGYVSWFRFFCADYLLYALAACLLFFWGGDPMIGLGVLAFVAQGGVVFVRFLRSAFWSGGGTYGYLLYGCFFVVHK